MNSALAIVEDQAVVHEATAGKVVNLARAYVIRALRRDMPATIAIHGGTRLATELGLDSLAMMELVFSLEDYFAISISLKAIARISTVDDLVNALTQPLRRRNCGGKAK